MIDIDTLHEQHYESFCDHCFTDGDLDDLVWEYFGSIYLNRLDEIFYLKQFTWDESIYDTAFDTLYKWDAEYLVSDPKACLMSYVESKK